MQKFSRQCRKTSNEQRATQQHMAVVWMRLMELTVASQMENVFIWPALVLFTALESAFFSFFSLVLFHIVSVYRLTVLLIAKSKQQHTHTHTHVCKRMKVCRHLTASLICDTFATFLYHLLFYFKFFLCVCQ